MEPKDVVSDIEVYTDKESQTVDIFHSQVSENTCLQISDKPFPVDRRKTPAYSRLLAISNIYGYMVAGTCKGLSVFMTADAQNELAQGKSKGTNTLVSLAAHKEVDLGAYGQVSHIGLTADELQVVVATCTGKLVVLSSASLLDKNASGLGKDIKVIDLGTEIRDVRTNPQEMPSLVAVLTLSGDVQIVDISSSSVKCIAAASDQITTSICWSRKGKQIICGDSSALLKQRVPTDGTVKRTIKPQSDDDNIQPDFAVLAVDWIDTYTFFALYGPFPDGALVPNNGGGGTGAKGVDDGVDDNMTAAYVITKSGKAAQTQQWIYIEDPCSSMVCPTRYPGFHIACLPDWGKSASNVVLMAGTGSDATMTIGQAIMSDMADGADADFEWAQWDIDGAMAVMPRSAVKSSDSSDTFPIGLAIDYTATRDLPPVTDDGNRVPSVPIMWILNTDACLLGYHIYNTYEMRRGGRCSKMVDQVKKLSGAASFGTSVEPPEISTPSKASSQQSGALPAAFAGSPFGGKQPSFGGGSSAFGASAGFTPSFGKPPSAAGVTGQPVFGSSSKLGASTTGSSGFGGFGGFGQAAPDAGESIFDKPSGGPSIFDAPNNGSSAFGAAKSSSGMSAFDNSKSASGFGGFGANTSNTTSSAFGASNNSSFGKPAASTGFGSDNFGKVSNDKPSAFGGKGAFGSSTSSSSDKPTPSSAFGSSGNFGQTNNDSASVFGGMGALQMGAQPKEDKKPGLPVSNSANKSVFGTGNTTAKPFGSSAVGETRTLGSGSTSGSSLGVKQQPSKLLDDRLASSGVSSRSVSPSEAAQKRREKEEKERKDREEKERKDREEKERKDREEKEAKAKEQREREENERKERERVEKLRREMERKAQDLLNRQYISTCNAFDAELKALAASVKSTEESIAQVRSAKLSPIQIDPTILNKTSLTGSLHDLCLDDTDSWNSVADVLLEALHVSSEELRASQKLLDKHVAQYVKIETKQEEVKRILETATSAIASPNATINNGLDPLQRECRKSLKGLHGLVSNTLSDAEVVLNMRVNSLEQINGGLSIERKLCDLSQRLSEKNYELDQLSSSLDSLMIGKTADDAREVIRSSGLPSDVPCSISPVALSVASPLTAAQGTPWSPEDLPFSTPVVARRNRGFGLREKDLYASSNPVSARNPISPEKPSEEPKSPVVASGSRNHPAFPNVQVRELVPRSHKVNRKASMALDDHSPDSVNPPASEFFNSAMYVQVRQQRQMVREMLTNSLRTAPVVRTPNSSASLASSAVPVKEPAMPNLDRYVSAFGKLKITKRVPTPEPVVPAAPAATAQNLQTPTLGTAAATRSASNESTTFGSVPSFGGGFMPTSGASVFGSGSGTGFGFGGASSFSLNSATAPSAQGQLTSFVPPSGAAPTSQGFQPTVAAAPVSNQSPSQPASISSGSDEKWVCDTCWIPNPGSAKICLACEEPNPNANASSAPAAAPAPITFGTANNNSASSSIFGSGFGTTTSTSTAPAPVSFGNASNNSAASSIFGSGFGSTTTASAAPALLASNEQKWRCDVCLIENPPTAKICLACETSNPNRPSSPASSAATSASPLFGGGLKPTVLFGNSSNASTRSTGFSLSNLGAISSTGFSGSAMTSFVPPSNTQSVPAESQSDSGSNASADSVANSDDDDVVYTEASEEYSDTDEDEVPYGYESSQYSYDGDRAPEDVVESDAENVSEKDSQDEYESDGEGTESADSDEHSHIQESDVESENEAEVPEGTGIGSNAESDGEDKPESKSEDHAEVPTEEHGLETGSQEDVGTVKPEPSAVSPAVLVVEPKTDTEVDPETLAISETKSEGKRESSPESESAEVPEEPTAISDDENPTDNEASVPAVPVATAVDLDDVHSIDSKSKDDVADGAESKEKDAKADTTPEIGTDSKEAEATAEELNVKSDGERSTGKEAESDTEPKVVTKDTTSENAGNTESSNSLHEEPVIVTESEVASQSSKVDNDKDDEKSADDNDDEELVAVVPETSEADHGHDSDGFIHISQLASSNESKEDVSTGSKSSSAEEKLPATSFNFDDMAQLISGTSIENIVECAVSSNASVSRATAEERTAAKDTQPQNESTTDHEHIESSLESSSVPEDTTDNVPAPDEFELLSRPESITDAAVFDSQDAALSEEDTGTFGLGGITAGLTYAAVAAASDNDLISNTSPPASPALDYADDSGSESDSVLIKDLKTESESEPKPQPQSDSTQGVASLFQPGKFGSIGSGSSSFFRSGTGAFANISKSTIASSQQSSSGALPSALTRSDAPIPEFGKNLDRPAFGVSSMSNTKSAKSGESTPGVPGVSGQMGPGFSARANSSFNAFASYARNASNATGDETTSESPQFGSTSPMPRSKSKSSPSAEARNNNSMQQDDPLRNLIEGSDDEASAGPSKQDIDSDSD